MRTIPREVYLQKKNSFSLNQIQQSVLIGTLLGDGGIRFHGNEARLHIKHSFNQLPLVEYKYDVFRNISSMKVRVFTQAIGKIDYKFAEFVTLTHKEFSYYHHMFYPSGKKIVPKRHTLTSL